MAPSTPTPNILGSTPQSTIIAPPPPPPPHREDKITYITPPLNKVAFPLQQGAGGQVYVSQHPATGRRGGFASCASAATGEG
ncbi:hypothetical protein BST61_g5511 [Cercospora zeina]